MPMMSSRAGWISALLISVMTTAYAAEGELRQDVEYGRAGDEVLQMDAWIPNGPGPFPAAIIVHGGAWVAGDRRANVQPLFRPPRMPGSRGFPSATAWRRI